MISVIHASLACMDLFLLKGNMDNGMLLATCDMIKFGAEIVAADWERNCHVLRGAILVTEDSRDFF